MLQYITQYNDTMTQYRSHSYHSNIICLFGSYMGLLNTYLQIKDTALTALYT